MHFRSDLQRKAVFASMKNRFSFTSDGYTTGSGVADAIAGLWPDPVPKDVSGSGVSNAIVNLWPDGTSGRNVGNGAANAIVKLWPGGNEPEDDMYVLYYPTGQFSEQEVLAARNEFDFPKAWTVSNDGRNYKLVLDKELLEKYYGGIQ